VNSYFNLTAASIHRYILGMNAQRLETSRLMQRFGFGPRPGEYAQALKDGVAATRAKVLTVPAVDAGAAKSLNLK